MSDSVPSCSKGEGNTNSSPSSPSYRWCFTLNNYTDNEVKTLKANVPKYCKKGLIGKEKGESGTPHLQGFVSFIKKTRTPSKVLGIPRGHFERCKGSDLENIRYCEKDGAIIESIGIFRPLKIEACLVKQEWQLNILKIVEEVPDYRHIHWIWEAKGNTGKTLLQKHIYEAYPGSVVLSGKGADMKNGVIEYIHSNGDTPKTVIINIPRSVEHISWGGLEEIKDMFFYSGKYEGGMVSGKNPHLLIFANAPAVDLMGDGYKFSEDRLIEHYIGK